MCKSGLVEKWVVSTQSEDRLPPLFGCFPTNGYPSALTPAEKDTASIFLLTFPSEEREIPAQKEPQVSITKEQRSKHYSLLYSRYQLPKSRLAKTQYFLKDSEPRRPLLFRIVKTDIDLVY
ncbi:hypothetical protein AVEN_143090-1 [Araneus ventricosus]|uniref:Uncharacterized protein n=1 Tax=Araneus ventricosus TaxID=182803 RepID=A0A4Y2I717_ARAVE|nr:hypothetical protein AVEN_143090-1 [Araneus ventricosus]